MISSALYRSAENIYPLFCFNVFCIRADILLASHGGSRNAIGNERWRERESGPPFLVNDCRARYRRALLQRTLQHRNAYRSTLV